MTHFTQHSGGARSRSVRATGFTLLELMVAMTAGAVVVSSTYFITGATSAYFREQQRISNTQGSLRYAMDELRRDIARAGFGATPDSVFYPSCQPSGIIGTQITALRLVQDGQNGVLDPSGDGHQVDGFDLEADGLELTGNYATSTEYMTRGVVGAGASVVVDPNWMGFTRDFVRFADNSYTLDDAAFGDAFRPGRLVRVRSSNGSRYFSRITGVVTPALPNSPSVSIGNPIIAPCAALGSGATVNPVSIMRYMVVPAVGVLTPLNAAAAGNNNVLVRREMNVGGAPLAGTFDRVVAERVVYFNVDLIQNTNAVRTGQPVLAPVLGAAASGASTANPARIFSAIVTLGIRTSLADNRFPHMLQPAGAELTRFRFDPNSAASTRVRIARAEIFLPNIAYEWTNN